MCDSSAISRRSRLELTTRTVLLVALVAACRFSGPSGSTASGDPDSGVDAVVDAIDGAAPTAWLHPWTHRRAITLHASQIEAPGDGALVDFPVLVSVTDAQIAATALTGGEDIVFTDGDATTRLASEIEVFTPGTGQLVAWVKVPALSATTDTTLYVYYGHPNPPLGTSETVWTADYLAAWHLHQDPGSGGTGEIRDATSGNHDGTADAQMAPTDSVSSRIGLGLNFDGTNGFLNFASMDFGNAFTISMWVEFNGGTSCKTLIANSDHGGDTNGFRFFINSANVSDRKIIFETGTGTFGSARRAETASNAIATDTFTHVAAVVDRTASTALIFVNGMSVATDTSIGNTFQTSSDFEVARMENDFLHLPGKLDEIQVASTLRSAEWLRTSFRNQAQPTSFHTLGPEQLAP